MNTVKPDPATIDTIREAWQNANPADNSWLHALKTDALDEFSRMGFPTTRLENWKYTDVSELAANYTRWLDNKPTADSKISAPDLDIAEAVQVHFVDGIYRPELADNSNLPQGVYAGSISDLLTYAPALKDRIGRQAGKDDIDSGLVALNTAFSGFGLAVVLPENQTLTQPIYLHCHTSTPQLNSQPRIMVDLGANSHATVIEHYTSELQAVVNTVTEIHCAANASLNYYKLQDEHVDTWHTAFQYAELENNARLHSTHIDIGGVLARNELRLRLAGRGAEADCKGLFMADANRHVDSRITVEHAAPDTRSRERYRGILGGTARGVFNGRIYVEADAQKTSAELTNRNLLLSKGAEIDTKPELEIYADDVKCAHGSTTGQLDETALFYLLSRGIDEQEARNILVAAFAATLVSDIGIEAITTRVQTALHSLRSAE
jgi:Fe-S cluster assembly protein SufD